MIQKAVEEKLSPSSTDDTRIVRLSVILLTDIATENVRSRL